MPIPIIAVPVAVGLAAAASPLVRMAITRMPNSKSVAILGGHKAGKSTLLRYLLANSVADNQEVGIASTSSGVFELQLGRRKTKFTVSRDLPSSEVLGHPQWRKAFKKADHIWYLFRSDLLAKNDPETVRRLRNDLDVMKAWRTDRGSRAPRIVLIGSWVDQVPDWHHAPLEVLERVRSTEPLKFGAVKLGNAPVVVGSLASDKDAEALVSRLKENLV